MNLDDKIRGIAQDVHDDNSTSDQFAVSQTPFHTHNGMDSQRIPFIGLSDTPRSYFLNRITSSAGYLVAVNSKGNGLTFVPGITTKTYVGYVNSDGSAGAVFPSGWTVAHTATGEYTVTHNLGVNTYTVVCSLVVNSPKYYVMSGFGTTSFEIDWYQLGISAGSLTETLTDTQFRFVLVLA